MPPPVLVKSDVGEAEERSVLPPPYIKPEDSEVSYDDGVRFFVDAIEVEVGAAAAAAP